MSFRDSVGRGDLHNMMVDPATSNSRIYIGNIPTSEITRKEIEDRFKKHGPVLGVSLNRGFGFVQYERETSAADAIKFENGAVFRGKKMEVNLARVYGKRDRSVPRRDERERGDVFRERSPVEERARDRTDWRADRERFDSVSSKGVMEHSDFYGRDSGFDKEPASYGNFKFGSTGGVTLRDDRVGSFGKEQFGTAARTPLDSRTFPVKEYTPPDPSLERTNDCEIIVVKKEQREYAEFIEHRLKQLGLSVDLLFPNEEVPIGRVLANISGRGTLYAIVVMPKNEEHRSLTLNILHGIPQEHRNMPLEDAVVLVKRDYEAYIHGEKSAIPLPAPISVVPAAPSAGLTATDQHPEAIQVLLNMLADNRQLTVLQYDRVIHYLQDRREVQLKLELGDAKDLVPPTKEPVVKQQTELQHRILNILNNSSGNVAPAPVPAPTPVPVAPPATSNWSQAAPTPLLSDPTVQKALDSLMQGNVLRKLASNTTTTSGTSSNPTLGTPPSAPLFGAYSASANRRF